MKYKYSYKDTENSAKAAGINLPISLKHAVNICSELRMKSLADAKSILEGVIKKRNPIRFRRYNRDLGHKKGMGPGRYPVKASREILKILRSAEANAQVKGLNTSNLIIRHIAVKKGSTQMRYGRHRGRQTKRSHLEVVLETGTTPASKKESKKEEKEKSESEGKASKEAPKVSANKEADKETINKEREKPTEKADKKEPVREIKNDNEKGSKEKGHKDEPGRGEAAESKPLNKINTPKDTTKDNVRDMKEDEIKKKEKSEND